MPELLMYLNNRKVDLPFRYDLPSVYPFNQGVNRVSDDFENPFLVKNNCESIAQIKTYRHNKTFEELCLSRAKELYKLAAGRQISLYWSGGIDSTTALVSFMKLGLTDTITVVCSTESIREYRNFWPIIASNFNTQSSFLEVQHYAKNTLVITGEHGDQILGSDLIKKVVNIFGEEYIHKPWQLSIPTVLNKMLGDRLKTDSLINRLEPTLLHSCYDIKSAIDYVWWYNFTNKWQHVKYRMFMMGKWDDPTMFDTGIRHFFDTPEFQYWAMTNPDKKIKDTLRSYKYIAKEFIVEYTKDEDYLLKKKIGSLSNIWSNKHINSGITTDYKFLTLDEVSQYLR